MYPREDDYVVFLAKTYSEAVKMTCRALTKDSIKETKGSLCSKTETEPLAGIDVSSTTGAASTVKATETARRKSRKLFRKKSPKSKRQKIPKG